MRTKSSICIKTSHLGGANNGMKTPVSITGLIELRKEWFPEVQWSDDEPTKVKITIEKYYGIQERQADEEFDAA